MQTFAVDVFSFPYGFLNNVFFSLAYFIVRIQFIIHIAKQSMCQSPVYVIGKDSSHHKLLGVQFLGRQKLHADFCMGIGTPVALIRQRSIVYSQISVP